MVLQPGDEGLFYVEGTAQTKTGTWSVQGHFDGNTKYAASDSNKENYQTVESPGPKIEVSPPQNNTIPYLPRLSRQEKFGLSLLSL